jgi:hypothetical protein
VDLTRQELAERAASLAAQGVYVGTSSWKYPGWCGTIYDRSRYEYRGAFAETRFKRDCLREYAEVFKTVCVEAAYYTFPSQQYLEGMVDQTPEDFRFGLKVTDAIKKENPEARAAGRALIAEGRAAGPNRRTFIFVNNRLEGNAISTIAAMLEQATA